MPDVQSSRSSASVKIVVGKNYKFVKVDPRRRHPRLRAQDHFHTSCQQRTLGPQILSPSQCREAQKTSPAGQIRRMQIRILWMQSFVVPCLLGCALSSFPNQAPLKKSHARDKSIGGKASICRCFDSPNVKGIGVPICKAPKRISAASSR